MSANAAALEHRVTILEEQQQRAQPGRVGGQTHGAASSMPPTETPGATAPAHLMGETGLDVLRPGEPVNAPPLAEWSTVVKKGKRWRLKSAMQPNVDVQVRPRGDQRRKI